MPRKNQDLHGNAPEKSDIALLIIDVISDFDFEDGEKLLKNTLPMAKKLAAFKKKAKKAKIPVIYVNDNFGKWQSDFKKLLMHCLSKTAKGCKIAELLKPDNEDYFVLKPKHSGFYSTSLDILLEYLDAKTLILTGVTADICILFTANDAYMRDFNLVVPGDCVASVEMDENQHALEYIERVLKADIRFSTEIDFEELRKNFELEAGRK
jgi:nicotinamidase-related amidase